MNKRRRLDALRLAKETLVRLDDKQLAHAAGGSTGGGTAPAPKPPKRTWYKCNPIVFV